MGVHSHHTFWIGIFHDFPLYTNHFGYLHVWKLSCIVHIYPTLEPFMVYSLLVFHRATVNSLPMTLDDQDDNILFLKILQLVIAQLAR